MAKIIPPGWREVEASGAAGREIDTLAWLEHSLADDYCVYHGVHWTNIENGFSVYGEIDFIVLAPNGRLLLIEQKSGFLNETPEGLVKSYQGRPRKLHVHIMHSIQQLLRSFGDQGQSLDIDYLLYCPDYQVKSPNLAKLDPSRIVDSTRRQQLPEIIRQLLPPGADKAQHGKVAHFLGDVMSLKPDPSAMIGQADSLVTRLSGGLAHWARQLEFAPFRLRIAGTAGSGKTQLALAEFQAALDQGLQPLYVCFNRPLADHVRRLLPQGGRIESFHMLCDGFARAHGVTPDYSAADAWQSLERFLAQHDIPEDWLCDVLIVDEGQDFSEAWGHALLRLLRPSGRALWLEDPLQNLYGRPALELPGWVTLHSQANYRSPRQIIDILSALSPGLPTAQAASPFLGAEIDILSYPQGDLAAMQEQTMHAITLCLGAGFTRQDIALISYHGRDKSTLLHLDQLGNHGLKSFTGAYDLFGNPVFRDGGLLAESVYRFKGQSAPAVIFTEIDFDAVDARVFRKLFVGMTRARLKLVLVASEPAAKLLRVASA